MNAVEEYRTARLWGSDMAEEQLCAADAAIAELEADLKYARADALCAQAELADLNTRWWWVLVG